MRSPVTLSLAVAVAAAAVVACGPSTPAETPGISAEPKATPAAAAGSPEGGECGDDVAIQKKCGTGLVCTPNPKAAMSEHTPGICKKP